MNRTRATWGHGVHPNQCFLHLSSGSRSSSARPTQVTGWRDVRPGGAPRPLLGFSLSGFLCCVRYWRGRPLCGILRRLLLNPRRLVFSPGGIVVEIVPAYVVVDGPRGGSHETSLAASQENYLLRAPCERHANLVYPCRHLKRPRGVTAYQMNLGGLLEDHRPV